MKEKSKIGNVTAIFLISVAVVVDGIQFLLTLTVLGSILSTLVTFFASIMFFLVFLLLGVKYTGKGGGVKLASMLGASVTELVPFLNAVPAWTAGVVAVIVQERLAEAQASGATSDPKKVVAIARLARMKAARSNLMEAGRTAREAQQMRRHPDSSPEQES